MRYRVTRQGWASILATAVAAVLFGGAAVHWGILAGVVAGVAFGMGVMAQRV